MAAGALLTRYLSRFGLSSEAISVETVAVRRCARCGRKG